MKKMQKLLTVLAVFAFLLGVFGSCTKEGPMGPQGDPGTDGVDGINGVDGVDGNSTCSTCHNENTDLFSIQAQWAASTHGTGANFERNGVDCARCHTSQGFVEMLETGAVADPISNPATINCRTCHNIHTNYDETDFALRTSTPVTFIMNGETSADLGSGNLCVNCHQPRAVSPMPVSGTTGTLNITSSRFGGHYGVMSVLYNGTGGYEIAGSETYASTNHKGYVEDGCVTCHKAEAYGAQAGGHTFKMGYEYHEELVPNMAACTSCHEGEESFDINGRQTEIAALLVELETELIGLGWILADGSVVAGSSSPLVLTHDQAGVLLNYRLIHYDRSNGVHNYKYIKALLQNSIDAAQGW